ncbi:MAG: hypothetical protein SVX28_10175, partial [Pseudomonadota bacterium]|nr:hypothetical protein [Pseudomonadota bacterium]
LNRGLYAVALRYVDVPTDIAEVFPTDLKDRRGSDYAVVTETVQLGLVPLPVAVPAMDELRLRARLMAELLDNRLASSVIPEDAVALGVLAIAGDTPQWVDSELLRHPPRPGADHDDLQADLYRQYQALLQEIVSNRASRGMAEQPFAASDYFPLIPPVGGLPGVALNPETGFQSYFPESFAVAISPVRQADLELIRQESMGLPAIDPARDQDVSVMVLAPLSDRDYYSLSRQLVADTPPDQPNTWFSALRPDPLALRLYRRAPSHTLDTDASVWKEIRERMDSDNLLYVRRPVRAAETGISGIVLARGSGPDPEGVNDDAQPEESTRIEDEHDVFLRMVNVPSLAAIRPPGNDEGEQAIKALNASLRDEPKAIRAVLDILLRTEPHYDPAIWQTLEQAHQQDNLMKLREILSEGEADIRGTAKRVITAGADLGLQDPLLTQWKKRLDILR